MRSTQYLAAVAALVTPTFAQTFTDCNPLKKTCPSDPALGKSVVYDLTKGAPSDFTAAAGKAPTFGAPSGGVFSITKDGEAPTLSSNWFMMFGHIKIVMKPSPGAGIVSSLVLQSKDLDEVDWEWVGSETGKVQTNYFGKGNTTTYDRGLTLDDPVSSDGFNVYEVDWTSEHLQWIINGKAVRTLTPATADYNQYPQSPMQFKLGNWPAGDSPDVGTSSWAGGKVDWSKGPYNMIVKSIEATDYSTGKSYSYGDMSGSWQSIKSEGGKVSGSGSAPDNVSTASASGSSLTSKPTASALSNQQPISSNSANSAQLGSGSGPGSSASAGSTGLSSGAAGVTTTGGSPSASPTTSSSTVVPSTGAGSFVGPATGFVAAGLLAVLAL